jgi:hypothetical protein
MYPFMRGLFNACLADNSITFKNAGTWCITPEPGIIYDFRICSINIY